MRISRNPGNAGAGFTGQKGTEMATFDAKHEASEVVAQWDGIRLERGSALDMARGNPAKAEELLREHWGHDGTDHSDDEIAEIARWIAKLA